MNTLANIPKLVPRHTSLEASFGEDHNTPLINLEEQAEQLRPLMEKIDSLYDIHFAKMAIPACKHWCKEIKSQSLFQTSIKITALPLYGGLIVIGGLTSYASLNLLMTGQYSQAFSSNVSLRVNFANSITNAGAIFACVTDFPAISYAFYVLLLRHTYQSALQEKLNDGYYRCLSEYGGLNEEMREVIYQRHLFELRHAGIGRFYSSPDPLSRTGKIYHEMAPILELIDRELDRGISFKDWGKNCVVVIKQDSLLKRIAKLFAGTLSFGIIGMSTFIMLENAILLKDTPVGSLFSGDGEQQNEEAFYLTQLGGFFSSLTAFGAATFMDYHLFFRSAYNKTKRDLIHACFAKYTPADAPLAWKNELFRIKEFKLKSLK